jgi:putative ABC transport system ATP-binding protein
MVAVMGPSGAGKTSLLLVLAKVMQPDEGVVRYSPYPDADSGSTMPTRDRSEPVVALVPQTLGLVSDLTVAENAAIPLQVQGVPQAEGEARVFAALTGAGIGKLAGRLVGELSGGQRQRVAVARAIAASADILIADEPTAELDLETQALVVGLFSEQAARGAAVLMATHDPSVVERCTRSFLLRHGQLVEPS